MSSKVKDVDYTDPYPLRLRPAQNAAIEVLRRNRALGGATLSKSGVMRALIDLGLEVVAKRKSVARGPRSAK